MTRPRKAAAPDTAQAPRRRIVSNLLAHARFEQHRLLRAHRDWCAILAAPLSAKASAMTSPLNDIFEKQRIENARLSGQIVALEMAVKLLFIQHPNPTALGAFYSKAIDGLLDITLATRMPEEMRDSLDQARNGILEALRQQPTLG
jgi:hypothetical protein